MGKKTRHYPHWYLLSLRGLFLISLGLYTLIIPSNPIITFARIFEVFTFVSGLLLIQNALLNRQHANWQFILFNGLFDLSFGIILWIIPELSLLDLKIVLAIWFLYSGLIQIVDSFILIHDSIKNWWVELISGMLSFILAFILIALRIKIQKEVFTLIGIFASCYGLFLVISSFILREETED